MLPGCYASPSDIVSRIIEATYSVCIGCGLATSDGCQFCVNCVHIQPSTVVDQVTAVFPNQDVTFADSGRSDDEADRTDGDLAVFHADDEPPILHTSTASTASDDASELSHPLHAKTTSENHDDHQDGDLRACAAMPCCSEPTAHRPKTNDGVCPLLFSLVARLLSHDEVLAREDARVAADIEIAKLQERCVFDFSQVQERSAVAAAYKARGQPVRFSRTFMIVSEMGSELLDPALRRLRARLVVGGDDVRDADNEPVFYCDYANAPTTCTATRVCIAYGNSPGCSCFVLDADAAYLQALLSGDDTYVSLPRWLWPKSWRRFKSPVLLLKRALYGHPLAGQSWYEHMAARLKSLGFVVVEGWDSVFVRGSVLIIIYVDDFMLSGPTSLAKAAAKDLAAVMSMGKAEPLSRFLACLYSVRPTLFRGSVVNVIDFDMRD
jgi:hypothetical protein